MYMYVDFYRFGLSLVTGVIFIKFILIYIRLKFFKIISILGYYLISLVN